MTSRRRFNDRKGIEGFLVLDAIIGITLASVFVGILASASAELREIVMRSAEKNDLIDSYYTHAADFSDMKPDETKFRLYKNASSTTSILARARWYGNDRVETDIEASSTHARIEFASIRSYPHEDVSGHAGTPICSTYFGVDPTIVPIILPISSSIPLTDLVVRNGIAYVSADSGKQSDPDLYVVDIRNPASPRLLSSINTGPGLTRISFAGAYVYAAAASSASQLHVIRVLAPNSLQLASRYALSLPTPSTTPPQGTAVFYDKGVAYLGTEKWDGDEFIAVDVSNPSSPRERGGFETGSKISSIYVRNGLAYVAASDQYQFRVVDTASYRLADSFSPSGWQRQEGKTVSTFEDTLDFGRTSGGFNIASDSELFEWKNSARPVSTDIPGGAYGTLRDRDRAYVITHTSGKEFAIFDSDMSSTTAKFYSLPALPQAIACDLGTIYILAGNASAIYEIKFTNT